MLENIQVKNVLYRANNLHIKLMGWNTETKCITNEVLLIPELQFTQFKGTSDHTELCLLNRQHWKEWWGRKPGMLVEWRQGNIKKPLVGSEYDMAYFLLHFIPGVQHIISLLVCHESAKTLAFINICGGDYRCRWHQYSECLCYLFTLGCVVSILSLSELEGIISG